MPDIETSANLNITAQDNTGQAWGSFTNNINQAMTAAKYGSQLFAQSVTVSYNALMQLNQAGATMGKTLPGALQATTQAANQTTQAGTVLGKTLTGAFQAATSALNGPAGLILAIAGGHGLKDAMEEAARMAVEFGKDAVKSFADVEQGQIRISEVTGASAEQMKKMAEQMDAIGRHTGQTIPQLNQDFLRLAETTHLSFDKLLSVFPALELETAAVQGSMEQTMRGVGVAMERLAVPGDKITEMLNVWTKMLPGMQDQFVGFLERSSRQMELLGITGPKAVETMAAVYKETSAHLGSATKAGAGFNQVMQQVTDGTLRQLLPQIQGMGGDVVGILKSIDDFAAEHGAFDPQHPERLKAWFPSEQAQLFVKDLHNHRDNLSDYAAEVENTGNALERFWNKMDKSLGNSLTRVSAATEAATTDTGELLKTMGVGDALDAFARGINDIDRGIKLLSEDLKPANEEMAKLMGIAKPGEGPAGGSGAALGHALEQLPGVGGWIARQRAAVAAAGAAHHHSGEVHELLGGDKDHPLANDPGSRWRTQPPQAFAEGGIVDKPTLGMLGEDGPEAVIPLQGPGDRQAAEATLAGQADQAMWGRIHSLITAQRQRGPSGLTDADMAALAAKAATGGGKGGGFAGGGGSSGGGGASGSWGGTSGTSGTGTGTDGTTSGAPDPDSTFSASAQVDGKTVAGAGNPLFTMVNPNTGGPIDIGVLQQAAQVVGNSDKGAAVQNVYKFIHDQGMTYTKGEDCAEFVTAVLARSEGLPPGTLPAGVGKDYPAAASYLHYGAAVNAAQAQPGDVLARLDGHHAMIVGPNGYDPKTHTLDVLSANYDRRLTMSVDARGNISGYRIGHLDMPKKAGGGGWSPGTGPFQGFELNNIPPPSPTITAAAITGGSGPTVDSAQTSGAQLGGRGSVFGNAAGFRDPTDSGKQAGGLPTSVPGIARYDRKTLGQWFVVTAPNGRQFVVQQTDIGPAPWTHRAVDIDAALAAQMGYTQKNFPTDANFSVQPYTGAPLAKGQHIAEVTPKKTASAPSTPSAPPPSKPAPPRSSSASSPASNPLVAAAAADPSKAAKAMAKGGVVNEPTLALIGEAGPEAVVPLGGGYGGGMEEMPGRSFYDDVKRMTFEQGATPKDIQSYFKSHGVDVSEPTCGQFMAAMVRDHGGTVPSGYPAASTWRKQGQPGYSDAPGAINWATYNRGATGESGSHIGAVQAIKDEKGNIVAYDLTGANQGKNAQRDVVVTDRFDPKTFNAIFTARHELPGDTSTGPASPSYASVNAKVAGGGRLVGGGRRPARRAAEGLVAGFGADATMGAFTGFGLPGGAGDYLKRGIAGTGADIVQSAKGFWAQAQRMGSTAAAAAENPSLETLGAAGVQLGATALSGAGLVGSVQPLSIAAHTLVDPALESSGLSHGAASATTDVVQALVNPAKAAGLAGKLLAGEEKFGHLAAAAGKIGQPLIDPVQQQISAMQAHADDNPIRLNIEAPSPKQFAPNRRSFARAHIRRDTENGQRSMRWQTHSDIGPQ